MCIYWILYICMYNPTPHTHTQAFSKSCRVPLFFADFFSVLLFPVFLSSCWDTTYYNTALSRCHWLLWNLDSWLALHFILLPSFLSFLFLLLLLLFLSFLSLIFLFIPSLLFYNPSHCPLPLNISPTATPPPCQISASWRFSKFFRPTSRGGRPHFCFQKRL